MLLRKFCCKKYYDGSYFMAERGRADRSTSITWGCFEKDYKRDRRRATTLDHKSNMIHLHASRDENKNAFFSLLQHFLLLIELEEGQWDSAALKKVMMLMILSSAISKTSSHLHPRLMWQNNFWSRSFLYNDHSDETSKNNDDDEEELFRIELLSLLWTVLVTYPWLP